MVSVLNKELMAATSSDPKQRAIQPEGIAEILDLAQRHEKKEEYFLAAECYQEAGEYQKALELYLKNVDEVANRRAIEDAWFGTLVDILKNEVDRGKLEELCGMPWFFTQDEFHCYFCAAQCAKELHKEEVFRYCLRTAVNICDKRAPTDKIYLDHSADCYELSGDTEKAEKFRNKFANA